MTGYEELLKAIGDVLEVPPGATPDGHITHRDILVDRAAAVRAAVAGAAIADAEWIAENAGYLAKRLKEHGHDAYGDARQIASRAADLRERAGALDALRDVECLVGEEEPS